MAVATEEVRLPSELTLRERVAKWFWETVPSIVLVLAVWETIAWIWGDPLLFPRVRVIFLRAYETIFLLAGDTRCVLCVHTLHTTWRILVGISIASLIGISIGIGMGRISWVEKLMMPILSMLLPVPALAWSPILVLWFGLGNTTMIFITAFAAALPIISATWSGVKTVSPVLVRAARSMNARGMVLFWKVIFPASLPFILSGIRIGLARAWRAGVAGEMVAASDWGLGYAIFDSREDLDIAFMLVGIAAIAFLGLLMEKFIFQKVEQVTVVKWGMMEAAASGGR